MKILKRRKVDQTNDVAPAIHRLPPPPAPYLLVVFLAVLINVAKCVVGTMYTCTYTHIYIYKDSRTTDANVPLVRQTGYLSSLVLRASTDAINRMAEELVETDKLFCHPINCINQPPPSPPD